MTAKLVILKDTREPKDLYTFRGEKWRDEVTVKLATLPVGDYSFAPWGTDRIFIERKTLPDYVASISSGRQRFEKEFLRANPNAEKWLLCEGEDFMDRLFNGEYRSKMRENSTRGTILKWLQKHGYLIFPVKDSRAGMDAIVSIGRLFAQEQAKGG